MNVIQTQNKHDDCYTTTGAIPTTTGSTPTTTDATPYY